MANINHEELNILGYTASSFVPGDQDLKEKAELILYNWIDEMYDEIDQLRSGK